MKTYRDHNCASTHRTYAALAKCIFRGAAWVQGEGPYACLAHCNDNLTVLLCATQDDANKRKADIDQVGCGGRCTRQHELVFLDR